MTENVPTDFMRVHASMYAFLPINCRVLIELADHRTILGSIQRLTDTGLVIDSRTRNDGAAELRPNPILFAAIARLWKQYDANCVIEMRLIYNSLADKSARIEQLEMDVDRLIKRIKTLENGKV